MLQRTLVVDDSVVFHKLIKTHLDSEKLEFHSAFDGVSGLTMAADIHPSLILLDVDMPDMDGFEVCRRLKANAATTTIPIIFLTADYDTKDKIKGLDLGAVDYVTKPFKPEELCARVRASLRTKQLLEQKAAIDGKTGLWNRKYLDDHLAAQMAMANRSGAPISCIALDVDGLREINRKHGMTFGDEVLRWLGGILLSQCRAVDAVCQCNGGKFAIIVPGMDRAHAGRLAERLCAEVQAHLLSRAGQSVGVTCSFGVADTFVAGDAALVERAETMLIRAKQNGGGCVCVARPPRSGSRQAA